MTTETNVHPIRSIADLTAELLDQQAAAAVIADRINHLKGQIADQLGVGQAVTLDDLGGITVAVREPSRRFDLDAAWATLTTEQQAYAVSPDAKKVKQLLPPLLADAFMVAGTGNPVVSVR